MDRWGETIHLTPPKSASPNRPQPAAPDDKQRTKAVMENIIKRPCKTTLFAADPTLDRGQHATQARRSGFPGLLTSRKASFRRVWLMGGSGDGGTMSTVRMRGSDSFFGGGEGGGRGGGEEGDGNGGGGSSRERSGLGRSGSMKALLMPQHLASLRTSWLQGDEVWAAWAGWSMRCTSWSCHHAYISHEPHIGSTGGPTHSRKTSEQAWFSSVVSFSSRGVEHILNTVLHSSGTPTTTRRKQARTNWPSSSACVMSKQARRA